MTFKLKRVDLDWVLGRNSLLCEGGEALAQVAQRCCGCPTPGSVQGRAGWGFEQPGQVKDGPAHGTR